MIKIDALDFTSYLPPYRSLLSPEARYDYKIHKLVPIDDDDVQWQEYQNNRTTTKDKLRMKYRSLLSDVSKKTSILSMKINNNAFASSPKTELAELVQIRNLPVEMLQQIFELIGDKKTYINCMFVSKQFYQLSKPHVYKEVSFKSTYRFAQFITYLRVNPDVGMYVEHVDLSQIEPGANDEDSDIESPTQDDSSDPQVRHPKTNSHDTQHEGKILAGWRDWKFKSNPVYSTVSSPLSKVNSNSQNLHRTHHSTKSQKSVTSKLSSSSKILRLSHLVLFKGRKRQKLNTRRRNSLPPVPTEINLQTIRRSSHPSINRLLISYATSKDLPIGYVLHLISICPNIVCLNLGNLSISTDYEISRSMMYKYKNFDIMNNYPIDLSSKINKIMNQDGSPEVIRPSLRNDSHFSIISGNDSKTLYGNANVTAMRSILSSSRMGTMKESNRPYNSLLSPGSNVYDDETYMKKGDGIVYLSDLSLKSINNNYLRRLKEDEILGSIVAYHNKSESQLKSDNMRLRHINLSSMIWLNKNMIKWFLNHMVLQSDNDTFDQDDSESVNLDDSESISSQHTPCIPLQDLVIDLSDSGMYKDLPWAKHLDLSKKSCRILCTKILQDRLIDPAEEFTLRERQRRGRMGENYLS